MTASADQLRDLALNARAWPFEEARKLAKRFEKQPPKSGTVIFETGYGPSGLPHIGTFGEVVRTTMVRQAFQRISDLPTKLICFSDDMDGLRKVPDNVPNQELLAQHLNKPLTVVPDPFGTHDSFGRHNNARLQAFLDAFGFDYEFMSSTDCYKSGMFDDALRRALECYDQIMGIMLPSLGPERRETYSIFLPISPSTGEVLQVPILETNAQAGTIVFEDVDGKKVEQTVTGGNVKLQWKPDWAMRWYALGVDYEMSGKDLIESVKLSTKITRTMGSKPPETLSYELFLDAQGQKISKSKGNGLAVEEWLRYAPQESLALYMFQKPKTAKRLHFDVIPKAVDEWLTFCDKFPEENAAKQLENPAWHIHNAEPPRAGNNLRYADYPSFAMLLNLASVVNADDKSVLWGFISRYSPDATPDTAPLLDRMTDFAVNYYQDFIKPAKAYRAPTDQERAALADMVKMLDNLPKDTPVDEIQTAIFTIGKEHNFENLRDWFKALYQTLLGQDQGPRFGSFVELYGIDETKALVEKALAGELATELAS